METHRCIMMRSGGTPTTQRMQIFAGLRKIDKMGARIRAAGYFDAAGGLFLGREANQSLRMCELSLETELRKGILPAETADAKRGDRPKESRKERPESGLNPRG